MPKHYAWINNKGYPIRCGCNDEWGKITFDSVQQCVSKIGICKVCWFQPWFEPPHFTQDEPIILTEKQYLEEISL